MKNTNIIKYDARRIPKWFFDKYEHDDKFDGLTFEKVKNGKFKKETEKAVQFSVGQRNIWIPKSILEKNIIILDIETTGLDPLQAEITEIGAIKVNSVSLEVVGAFDKLIKIANPVPEKITELTGITSELLNTKGKNLKNVLKELSEFCGGYDIYAHNANFDKGFIRKALDDNKIEYHQSDWVDTITIFKKTFPNRTTYKLSSLIVDYKLADKEDHRALSDAQHLLSLIKLARETETADIVKNVVKKQKEKPFVDNAVTIKHTTAETTTKKQKSKFSKIKKWLKVNMKG